jgi:hypothetical protein
MDQKQEYADEIEAVLTFPGLSEEDAAWLAAFSIESKKKAVRKVCLVAASYPGLL